MAAEAGASACKKWGACVIKFALEVEDRTEFRVKAGNFYPAVGHPSEIDGFIEVEGPWVRVGDFSSLQASTGKDQNLSVLV